MPPVIEIGLGSYRVDYNNFYFDYSQFSSSGYTGKKSREAKEGNGGP
jgi:hypothetical protein